MASFSKRKKVPSSTATSSVLPDIYFSHEKYTNWVLIRSEPSRLLDKATDMHPLNLSFAEFPRREGVGDPDRLRVGRLRDG
ncbi:hypothetical protein CDAR_13491 [Caerostris darwini]|uniref:Uncharacterized protein n=1 Tax=Caerostris darwini TaxID=1538125 RepID=A0AAV4UDX3_9ARAC|nr:hypothetical protein CDAR_13491 [Caerostris darwini]